MGLKRISIQLNDAISGQSIIVAGGKCLVLQPGTPDKAVIYNPVTEVVMANPMTLVRGKIDFAVQDTYNTVDIDIQTPAGRWLTVPGVVPSGPNEVLINTSERLQFYRIPFSIADAAANVEQPTGIFIPATGVVQPYPLVRVTTLEAARTLNVGSVGTAAGFIAAASLAVAGLVKASLATPTATLGADLRVQDSVTAGDLVPEQNVSRAGLQIGYTLSAGTVAAKGFITLPVLLAG